MVTRRVVKQVMKKKHTAPSHPAETHAAMTDQGNQEDNPISIHSDDEMQSIEGAHPCPFQENTTPTPDVPTQAPAASGPLSDGAGTAEYAHPQIPATFQDGGTSEEPGGQPMNMDYLSPRLVDSVRDALGWDEHLESFQTTKARQEGESSLLKEDLAQKDQEIARWSQEILQLKQNKLLYMRKDAVLESFEAMEARQERDISLLKEELAQRSQGNARLSQEISLLKQNEALYMRKDAVDGMASLESFVAMEKQQEGAISLLKGELDQTNQELDRLSQEIIRLKQHEALYIQKDALGEVPSMESFLAMEARQEGDISFVKKELSQKSQEIARLRQNEALYMRKDAVGSVPSMDSFLAMEARQVEDFSSLKQEIARSKQKEALYMRKDALDEVPSLARFLATESQQARQEREISLLKDGIARST
ncbi:hypothetical protein BJX66DRAFT_332950 [Aspergillus keveii]|uniref:Uncharacterized protein n=1 Tax=Aspergillus keveii TaxID=714993 RepID=A0ABR4GK78_9EURO